MRAIRTDAGKRRSRAWWALAASAVVVAGAFVGPGAWTAGGAGASAPSAAASSPAPAIVPSSGGGALTPAPVSPASAVIDPGETITLKASASGGVAPYSFAWYAGTYSECSGDLSGTYVGAGTELNVSSPSPLASPYFCYSVTDSNTTPTTRSPSLATLVAVNATLVAGPIGPGPLTIDSGKSVTLTADPSGGVPAYRVSWTSNTTGSSSCLLVNVPSMPVTPTQSTTYCYTVTDSSAGTPAASAQSAPVAITVEPALVAGAVTPAGPVVDSGGSVVLTAAPSGGTGAGTYTIQWYAGTGTTCPTGKATGPDSATYSLSDLTATTAYCYSITDTSYGSTATFSGVDTVTVKGALTAGAVSPAAPAVDSGQTLTLTAEPSSGTGTGTYSYQWYYGTYPSCSATTATPIVGQTNATYVFVPGASEYYCYAVTDTSYGSVPVFSAGDLVTVNAPPSAGAISPVSPTIDDHQYVGLTADPTGGTAPYGYSWYSDTNASCGAGVGTKLSNASKTIEVNPASPTFYCYEVTDSAKGTPAQFAYSAADEVSVNSPLVANPIAPASPTIDGGQSIELRSNATGGTPVYSYLWYNGTNCKTLVAGQTNATLLVTPRTNTSYCYSVTDGSANPPTKLSAADAVVVERTLLAGAVTPSPASIDLGQSLSLNATPTGGKSPYSYVWYNGSSPTCAADTTIVGDARTLVVRPAVSTYYCYTVTDSLANPGHVNSTAALVTVAPALVAGSVASPSTILDKGESATLSLTPAGGTAPIHEQWYDGSSSNCSNDTTKAGTSTGAPGNLTVKPSTVGTVYYCAVVTDGAAGIPASVSVSATYPLVVHDALAIGAPVPEIGGQSFPGPATFTQGQRVTLLANFSGGTPTLSFAWYESSTSKCDANSTRLSGADASFYNFTASVSAYFCVGIVDGSNGEPPGPYFSPAEQVTVNPPPGPTFLGFPEVEGVVVLGVLLGLAALVGFFVYRRLKNERNRKGPQSDFL